MIMDDDSLNKGTTIEVKEMEIGYANKRELIDVVLVKIKGNAVEGANKLDVFDQSSRTKWH